jgi:hypothetical protein
MPRRTQDAAIVAPGPFHLDRLCAPARPASECKGQEDWMNVIRTCAYSVRCRSACGPADRRVCQLACQRTLLLVRA